MRQNAPMRPVAPFLALSALFSPAQAAPQEALERPNVLVLLIDDLGLEVLSAYDAENLYPSGTAERVPLAYPRTPTIDRLAREGVRFTQARVPPTCSTTRATILSGRYPFRHGIGGIIRRADTSERYKSAETIEFGVGEQNREWTLAHLAGAAGYRSFMAGKWHLALLEKNVALDGVPGYGWEHVSAVAGFDDYWATWGNLPGYPKPESWRDPTGVTHRPGYFNFVAATPGEVENVRGEYVTSTQIDRVLGYVDEQGDEPWLVYCSFNAAHSPYQLPPDGLVATEHYLVRGREEMKAARESSGHQRSAWPFYLAMVEALDHEIGRLLDGLAERGRLAETVILLVADNGTPALVMHHGVDREDVDLGELAPKFVQRGRERFKHTVWEPGVRVPLIVTGPVVGSPGRTSDVLIDGVDVFETVRELLGVSREELGLPAEQVVDGVSFLPVLRSPEAEEAHPRRFSFVEHFEPNGNPERVEFEVGRMNPEYMVRRALILETDAGRFKLLRNHDHTGDGRDRLFQLTDAEGAPVDPWEVAPLRTGKDTGNKARLFELRERLDELLKSEADNWN
jgi:arylsulfatase A-like enzyme